MKTTPAPPSARTEAQVDDLVGELHRAHALTLVRMANLLLRDRHLAEDVVQDAFLSLYRVLPKLTDHDAILPYLRTTVLNRARSALRTRRRALTRPVIYEPDVSSAESAAMITQDRQAVIVAVSRLPRRAREILVLRYYLDLSEAEIATTLGVSRGTVSSTVSRALSTLGRQLKEDS
ncbi:MAG TPA: SigE family RNA polymerase sigma factor [Streptosporangiaceae bacterium]|nr:SigE family RNA polymerase sigma factor [Streptosporangiaceae bacterium]